VAERADLGRGQVGDVNLLDRLDEECRLGQDLDVNQPRRRLERDDLELLPAMHPYRREDVGDRNREQPAVGHRAEPSGQLAQPGSVSAANDMIPGVDCLEQRVQVACRPRGAGRCHQNNRLIAFGQSLRERFVPAVDVGSDHDRRRFSTPLAQQLEQSRRDRLRAGRIFDGEHDDTDVRLRQRLSFREGVERVDPVEVLGHDASRRDELLALSRARPRASVPPKTSTPLATSSTTVPASHLRPGGRRWL
jgi:hypothetical protein